MIFSYRGRGRSLSSNRELGSSECLERARRALAWLRPRSRARAPAQTHRREAPREDKSGPRPRGLREETRHRNSSRSMPAHQTNRPTLSVFLLLPRLARVPHILPEPSSRCTPRVLTASSSPAGADSLTHARSSLSPSRDDLTQPP